MTAVIGAGRQPLLYLGQEETVTLREAARIAGVSVDHPLATLRRTVGETGPAAPHAAVTQDARGPSTPKPAALSNVPESRRRYVDVREDIHRNREPFAKI